jgi:hypothetical protein
VKLISDMAQTNLLALRLRQREQVRPVEDSPWLHRRSRIFPLKLLRLRKRLLFRPFSPERQQRKRLRRFEVCKRRSGNCTGLHQRLRRLWRNSTLRLGKLLDPWPKPRWYRGGYTQYFAGTPSSCSHRFGIGPVSQFLRAKPRDRAFLRKRNGNLKPGSSNSCVARRLKKFDCGGA